MKRQRWVAAIALALWLSGAAAAPILQFQSRPFDLNHAFVQPAGLGFLPFDTALGTLESVTVDVSGVVSLISPTTPNLIPTPPLGQLLPTPYFYQITHRFDLAALAGFTFAFPNEAQFIFAGAANGDEVLLTAAPRPYSLSVAFDNVSDLTGFGIPSTSNIDIPPGPIAGTRAGFEENLITGALGLQFQLLSTWQIVASTGAAAVITPAGRNQGVMTLTYQFSPFVQQIPVPPALPLILAASLAMLGARRMRRRG
ncbi:MAG: hypothetical protein QNJ91_05810 [Gammaproteobacteria bacterium]|nr:hypothetical protein [Gammaproteobacteria bacterium]